MKAGIPLTDALVIIGDETTDLALQRTIIKMVDDLRNGLPSLRTGSIGSHDPYDHESEDVGGALGDRARRGWRRPTDLHMVDPAARSALNSREQGVRNLAIAYIQQCACGEWRRVDL